MTEGVEVDKVKWLYWVDKLMVDKGRGVTSVVRRREERMLSSCEIYEGREEEFEEPEDNDTEPAAKCDERLGALFCEVDVDDRLSGRTWGDQAM